MFLVICVTRSPSKMNWASGRLMSQNTNGAGPDCRWWVETLGWETQEPPLDHPPH